MNMQGPTVATLQPAQARFPFAQALSVGDLESAVDCFARDGCLITPDATAVHGRDRIRPLLAQMVARQTEIRVDLSSAIGTGDVILARERWTVRSGGTEVPPVEQTLTPTLVLRRIEGTWKLAIAAPWADGRAYP